MTPSTRELLSTVRTASGRATPVVSRRVLVPVVLVGACEFAWVAVEGSGQDDG